jgi:protein TonB
MGMPSFPPHQTTPAILPSLNPDASGIYVVGDGVTPPKVLSQPPPKFSEIARQQKISGIVTLSLIVDKEGNPVNVHVIKSIADTVGVSQREAALTLDQAAVDAVRQYKFSPATKNGVPVAVYLNVNVNFEIF